MSANKPDILLIQKYLNGELDARAMHELERRALDEPFLMEALEGYEANGKNQRDNLAGLQKQLQQRIAPKQRRLWPVISIAASVLIFMSIGGWWLLNYRPPANKPDVLPADKTGVAKIKPAPAPLLQKAKPAEAPVIKPAAPAQPSVVTPIIEEVPEAEPAVVQSPARYEGKAFRPANKDSSRLKDDAVVIGYGSLAKKSASGYLNNSTADSAKAKSIEQALVGRLAGVNVTSGQPGATTQIRIRGSASIAPQADANLRVVTGQVLDEIDKKPLPGVSVRSTVNGLSVQTDVRGRFKIPVTDKDELNIAAIGYESKKLKVKGKDSLSVTLTEHTGALADVVVVARSNQQQEVIEEAHPKTGWTAFYKYLDEEARITTGKTGIVRLSFVVNPDRSLSDFKILKSLSPEADKEAIDIIKDGADWIPNINGKPETVKLRIRFRKED